jgi:TonB family protein
MFGDVVVLEVSLDDAGNTRGVRVIQSSPAFDAVAKDAVSRWRFRGASFRSRPVASAAYVIMGFAPPLAGSHVTPR